VHDTVLSAKSAIVGSGNGFAGKIAIIANHTQRLHIHGFSDRFHFNAKTARRH
jgi:hypothetical protein